MPTFNIYCIENSVNGKRYVGQTVYPIEKRWKKHVWLALSKNANTRFYEAIRKHGAEAFSKRTLLQECLSPEAADAAEIAWISAYSAMDPLKGYNMMSGGVDIRNVVMSPDACAKISASKLGKLNTTRRSRTLEEDRPIVEAFKSGTPRAQIAKDLCVSPAKVQKALARWKERVDPGLQVGKEYQYTQSGASLQDRADELVRPMVASLMSGLSYHETADVHQITYGRVKQIVNRVRARPGFFGVQEGNSILVNKNRSAASTTDSRDAPIIELFRSGLSRKEVSAALGLPCPAVKQAISRWRSRSI